MAKRVLLTGAAGFVGSHVLRHILTVTDWEVVAPVTFRHEGITDRLVSAMEGQDQSRVTIIQTDLSAPISAVTAAKFGRINFILNVASASNVDDSIENPGPFIQNNVNLITNILDYARTLPELEVFLQVSTDEVYGPARPEEAHREWIDGIKPSNPYSASKAAQEAIAYSYWRTYDVPLVISNTMNIIGETQSADKMFMKTLKHVLNGTEMTIHASAEGKVGSRFYLHARNQADGLVFLLRNFQTHAWLSSGGVYSAAITDRRSGEIESLRYSDGGTVPFRFHIVGEREVDNLELARMIADAAGKPLKYRLEDFHSSRPGHDLRYALDGEKIEALGWEPPVPLEKSIKSIVKWTLDHPEWLNA